MLRVRRDRGQGPLLRGRARGAHTVPRHDAVTLLEGHGQPLEIPSEGAQRPEEVHAEDEVEAAQREPDTGDGEGLAADDDGDVAGDPLARDMVAVGDRDVELFAPLWSEPQAAHGRALEEGVGGADVQQGEEALALDRHRK